MLMSAPTIRPVLTRADRTAFVDFAWEVYKDDSAWIPPLKSEVHALMNLCMAATYDPDPRAPLGFRSQEGRRRDQHRRFRMRGPSGRG